LTIISNLIPSARVKQIRETFCALDVNKTGFIEEINDIQVNLPLSEFIKAAVNIEETSDHIFKLVFD